MFIGFTVLICRAIRDCCCGLSSALYCPENRTQMTLIELINADKISANQLFPRKSASRFSSHVAHESAWRIDY
jgi:hypothetical protein